MNIFFNPLSSISSEIPYLVIKNSVLSSLIAKHRRILLVATFALGCLVVLYKMIYRFCLKIEPANKVSHNLQELENINEQTKDAGFKGNSIFVDITSEGGERAIKVLKNLDRKQEKEQNKGISSKTCHFGVACFVNYSIAAATKAEKIILLDYDPIVVKFNKIAREALIVSSTREEFNAMCEFS